MNTNLAVVEHDNRRVLTSIQLAQAYETEPKIISNNFNRNKERYIEGKHFYVLEGGKLKDFKTNHQFDESSRLNKLYLWTQNGTLLHAKSLNTDKAWEVYQNLVDYYFTVRDKQISSDGHQLENQESTFSLTQDLESQKQIFDKFRADMGRIFKLVDRRLTNAEDTSRILLDQVEKLTLLKNAVSNYTTIDDEVKETPLLPVNPPEEMLNTSVQFYEDLRELATTEDGYIGDEYVVRFKRLLGRFKNRKLVLKNKFDEQTIFENFQYEYHPAVKYGSSKSFGYFLLKCATTGTYKRIFVCDIKEVKGRKLFLTDCTLRYELL